MQVQVLVRQQPLARLQGVQNLKRRELLSSLLLLLDWVPANQSRLSRVVQQALALAAKALCWARDRASTHQSPYRNNQHVLHYRLERRYRRYSPALWHVPSRPLARPALRRTQIACAPARAGSSACRLKSLARPSYWRFFQKSGGARPHR